jgi:surface polysaccharide O-acyltransferase-like enzyme
MYLNSLNYFRALAIVFIVFGHCLLVADFEYTTVLGKMIHNLVQAGTFFFVIISGFLFHHIFYKNFNFKVFYPKKLKYVFFPYLIMSVIPILYLIFNIGPNNENSLFFLKLIFFNILNGEHLVAYWYIPFVMIVFALSPIFIRFIRLRLKIQIIITLLFFGVSILIHRPISSDFMVFQSVLYFTPAYMFGIMCSERKEFIYSKFKGKEYYLISLTIIIALLQVFLGNIGNYHKNPFEYNGIDLILIQKIVFSVFFIVWLHQFENVKIKLLEIIAINSFGVFFIHGFLIKGFNLLKIHFDFSFPENSFLIYFLMALLIFSISLVSSMLIRKTIPKYSRYIIGS